MVYFGCYMKKDCITKNASCNTSRVVVFQQPYSLSVSINNSGDFTSIGFPCFVVTVFLQPAHSEGNRILAGAGNNDRSQLYFFDPVFRLAA